MPNKRVGRPSAATRQAKAKPGQERQTIQTSLYLAEGIYEALRTIAFEERRKMHDIVIEGIELALRNRGYPSVEDLKSAKRK